MFERVLPHEPSSPRRKPGVQGLNNKAALGRLFHCVAFGELKSYLRVAPPRTLGDFCFGKSHQNHSPRMAQKPHCASRRNRRSPQLAGRKLRATGSNTRLASPDSGCDARARHTGLEQHLALPDFTLSALWGLLDRLILPNNPTYNLSV